VPDSTRFDGWGGFLKEQFSLPLIEGKYMTEDLDKKEFGKARAAMLTVST